MAQQTELETDDYADIGQITLPCPACGKDMLRKLKEVVKDFDPGRTDYSYVCEDHTQSRIQVVSVPHRM